jgi:hypothetical protein
MPAIWTFGQENITGIDLSANAFWRITLSAVQVSQMSWLALVMIYPPAPGQTLQSSQIVLAKAGIPAAEKVEDVLKLAQVSVSTGTLENDQIRMNEAFLMFKNSPKAIKQEVLESNLRDATEILKAYWTVRKWLEGGATEKQDVPVPPYILKLIP